MTISDMIVDLDKIFWKFCKLNEKFPKIVLSKQNPLKSLQFLFNICDSSIILGVKLKNKTNKKELHNILFFSCEVTR